MLDWNGIKIVISIHAPRTGSDLLDGRTQNKRHYFNPRSPHGERRAMPGGKKERIYFNPRSPHGERPRRACLKRLSSPFQSTLPARGATAFRQLQRLLQTISIHAPRTGSDRCGAAHCCLSRRFQSTLPARGATSRPATANSRRIFQSTLPARGATKPSITSTPSPSNFNPRSPHGERRARDCGSCRRLGISIHAPRTGSDVLLLSHWKCYLRFQSTLPARGATGVTTTQEMLESISIHAPRTGSDVRDIVLSHVLSISIHAPRTGSDCRNPVLQC